MALKTIQQLKREYEKQYNEELEKTGIFWAFSNEQFEENRTHKRKTLQEDSQMYKNYLAIGSGGYIHKQDKEKLDYFFKVTAPKLKKDFQEKTKALKEEHILYELLNHESFYTGSIDDTLDALKGYDESITEQEVIKVFRKYQKKYS